MRGRLTLLVHTIVSLLYWIFVAATLILLLPITILIRVCTYWWDPKLSLLQSISNFLGIMYLWIMPFWSIEVINRKLIDPHKVYMIIANHQSITDTIVICHLRKHMKWVSKTENFRIPILGWLMRLNNYIEVDRADPTARHNLLKDCETVIQRGSSVIMFPEGTRTRDGEIGAFKEGAFKVALEFRIPILPVLLDGSMEAVPRRGIIFMGNHKLKLKVLPVIPYESFKDEDCTLLAAKIRRYMVQEFEIMRLPKQQG
jgi:1-acyl-sn-glycerol-3-phosphate acyltransferase